MTALQPEVEEVFASVPPGIRTKMMALRSLILDTADATDGVGPITETLKWGEPAYLTSVSKSGSTIRIGWKASAPKQYALYFNCQTNLVDTFRSLFPETFEFLGNRGIVFEESDAIPVDALAVCVKAALLYHRNKKLKA